MTTTQFPISYPVDELRAGCYGTNHHHHRAIGYHDCGAPVVFYRGRIIDVQDRRGHDAFACWSATHVCPVVEVPRKPSEEADSTLVTLREQNADGRFDALIQTIETMRASLIAQGQ